MRKPDIDPITGCAHVKNEYGYMLFRVCSVCGAVLPEIPGIEEIEINYCWKCGIEFDHNDDDEVEYAEE